jgi:DNA-binding beta-propeller fold protein YncE
MSFRKMSWRVVSLVILLCALMIAGRLATRGRLGLVAQAQAQTDNWTTPTSQRMGIRLLETRDASGPPAYPVQAGDLLFFTNVGVGSAGKNTTDAVVVINAKTKKPIAISDLHTVYTDNFGSHSIGLSPDAKYIYLPSLVQGEPLTQPWNPEGKVPNSLLVLDAKTLKLHQVIVSGGPPHHVKLFRDWTGKTRVLVEDWSWSSMDMNGKGIYELDPNDNNKVVNGLLPGIAHGSMYTTFPTPDGKYFYTTMPAPLARELRPILDGWLAKVDMQTWNVVESIPMKHYPLWTVFSKDGKWAWVTQSANQASVLKIQRANAPGGRDKVVAEMNVGPGPYGMRLTWDNQEVWVANKGEFATRHEATISILDPEKDTVKTTLQTGCLSNDHIILSPDGQEMWATCNRTLEVVVIDAKTHEVKTHIPMPNQGDSHGGVFVSYSRNSAGGITAEVVSDQAGLQGSALDAYMKGTPWVAPASR